MNLIQRAVLEFLSLPRLMQAGLVILVVGGGLDIIYHASPSEWIGTLEIYLGPDGYYAHVVTLIGMVVTLAGLLASRWLPGRRRPQGQHSQ